MKTKVIRPDRGLYGLFEHLYRRATEQECKKLLGRLEGQCPPSEPARYAEACALQARLKDIESKRYQPRTYTAPKRPQNTTQGVVAYVYDGRIIEKKAFERFINLRQQPQPQEMTLVEDHILA